jgi:hypothetical protein
MFADEEEEADRLKDKTRQGEKTKKHTQKSKQSHAKQFLTFLLVSVA